MLRQVTAEVQPRLAAQSNSAVSVDRTRMVNITFSHHFCSWYTYMTKHISHTCGRRSCSPPRYLSSSTQPYFQAVSCNSSSSVFLNHYRILRTKQRRRSKASGVRKQCHEGSTASSHVVTPLVYSCCSTYSSKLFLYFSWSAYILRLSEIRPIPWFLTEEVEVLVDSLTRVTFRLWIATPKYSYNHPHEKKLLINKVEPGTNDRLYGNL